MVTIVIPVYKSHPSHWEQRSLHQCLQVLGRYDITLVTHPDCPLDTYDDIAAAHGVVLRRSLFPASYFASVAGYNRLMLSKEFYQRFADKEYILIYQLDAWVFADRLEEWCLRGYDYIGAPVHFRDNEGHITPQVWGVGNGGLSLRRVSYCLRILAQPKWRPFLDLGGLTLRNDMRWHSYLGLPLRLLGHKNTLGYFLRKNINEDILLSIYAAHSFAPVHIPDAETARRFAVESLPSHYFPNPTQDLPFGCHAFEKNEFDNYWKTIMG